MQERDKFVLKSKYQPTGDQPKAIKELVESIRAGHKEQTLLGVTGSGKTFTMANVIAKLNRPTLVLDVYKRQTGVLQKLRHDIATLKRQIIT